jgi:glycosyltransferase involved in cell wall biosynthesis
MSSINSLLESAAGGWKNLQNDAARMASKWAKTGLLEGLSNETDKNNMSMILENQAKQLVTEVNATNQGGAQEQIDDRVTGFLVPTHDAIIAAQKLGVLVNNPDMRTRMGQVGAKKLQEQFSLATFNKNIVDQIV